MPSNGDQNRSPPIGAALSASRVLGPPLHAGLATNRRYSPAASSFSVTAASTLDPFALYTAFPMLGLLRVLRPTPSASTGDRSSPLRTTRRRTSRDQRSGSHVHSRTLQRGRCPAMPLQPRHRYSAVVHRGLPGRRHQPAKEFPARPKPAGTRCNPAHICQVGAGGAILRGFRPLVPHVHLLVSLAGPTPSDSAGMSRLCRGCFCLHRCPPDRVAPSFNRSAATNRWQWSFTTAGFRAPRGARCPRTTPDSVAQS